MKLFILVSLYIFTTQTNAGHFYPSFYNAPGFQPVYHSLGFNQPQFYLQPFQPQLPTINQPFLPLQAIVHNQQNIVKTNIEPSANQTSDEEQLTTTVQPETSEKSSSDKPTPEIQQSRLQFDFNQPQFYLQPFQSQFPVVNPPFLPFQPIIHQQYNLKTNIEPSNNQTSSEEQPTTTPQIEDIQNSGTDQPDIQQSVSTPLSKLFPSTLHHPENQGIQSIPSNLLGFSYRTHFEDGANAAVVFFQGGHGHDMTDVRKRITVASDSVDPQSVNDLQTNIEKALSGRSGKVLQHPSVHHTDLSPLVSAFLGNPSAPIGTYYYYVTDGISSDTQLFHPIEETSTAINNHAEGETTTSSSEEATKQDEEDVGEETEPAFKSGVEPAESMVRESIVSSNQSKEESDSPSIAATSSTDGTSSSTEASSTEASKSTESSSIEPSTDKSSSSTTEGDITLSSSSEGSTENNKASDTDSTTASSS